jgi:hypothetical protein
VRRDGAELQLDVPAAVALGQRDVAAVPGNATRAVALRHIGLGVEGLFDGPVMRQVEAAPGAVVELDRGRTRGAAGLGGEIGLVVVGRHREGDVARVEEPAAVQRQPLAAAVGLHCQRQQSGQQHQQPTGRQRQAREANHCLRPGSLTVTARPS